MLRDLIVIARLVRVVWRFAFLLLAATTPALAQGQSGAAPQTREEVIAGERADKVAELWPERQNAMVDMANGLSERGLKEGLESGKGANGIQLTLGGMREAQGTERGPRLPPVGPVSRAAGDPWYGARHPERRLHARRRRRLPGAPDGSHVPALVYPVRTLATTRLLRSGEQFGRGESDQLSLRRLFQ